MNWLWIGYNIGIWLGIFVVPFLVVRVVLQSFNEKMSNLARLAQAKGQESKEIKRLESDMADDVIDKIFEDNPEIKMVIKSINPEWEDWIKENPKAFMTIFQRYAPFINQVMGGEGGSGSESGSWDYR